MCNKNVYDERTVLNGLCQKDVMPNRSSLADRSRNGLFVETEDYMYMTKESIANGILNRTSHYYILSGHPFPWRLTWCSWRVSLGVIRSNPATVSRLWLDSHTQFLYIVRLCVLLHWIWIEVPQTTTTADLPSVENKLTKWFECLVPVVELSTDSIWQHGNRQNKPLLLLLPGQSVLAARLSMLKQTNFKSVSPKSVWFVDLKAQ